MKRSISSAMALFVICISLALFTACTSTPGTGQSTTLGNGKVDPVEAASLRVAVGLAFTARPDTVAPAYAVSTAILAVLPDANGTAAVPMAAINEVIASQTAKLKLDPLTLQSFNDLVALATAQITQQLGANVQTGQALVVVHDVVAIIRDSAAARLGVLPLPAAPVAPVAPAPAPAATVTPAPAAK